MGKQRITGIGGVFFRARDPRRLLAWYEEHLGVPLEKGYVVFAESRDTHWVPFAEDTEYWPAVKQHMVNFTVRDLDAMLAQLRGADVDVDEKIEEHEFGRFGWATDPEGNRFELWQPLEPHTATMSPADLRDRVRTEIAFVGGHADVWRLFDDPVLFHDVVAALTEPFRDEATKVAGIEARGFILGTAATLELGVGFVPIRKSEGLFPGPKAVVEAEVDYRGNRQELRLQRASISVGDRVLLVDDWVETGSQARATKRLVEDCGATLLGVATVVTELGPAHSFELGRLHSLVAADELSTDEE